MLLILLQIAFPTSNLLHHALAILRAPLSHPRARDLLIWGSERALARGLGGLFSHNMGGSPTGGVAALGPLYTDEVTPLGGTLTLRPAKSSADYSPLGHLARKRILVLRTLFI